MKTPLIGGLLSGEITRRSSTGSAPHTHRGVDGGIGLGVREGGSVIRGGDGTRTGTARVISGGGHGSKGGGGVGGGIGGGVGGVSKGARLPQSKSPVINKPTGSNGDRYSGSRKTPGGPALLPLIKQIQPVSTVSSDCMSHQSAVKADTMQDTKQPLEPHSSGSNTDRKGRQGDTLTPVTKLKNPSHADSLSPLNVSTPTLPLTLNTTPTVLKPLGCCEGPSTGASDTSSGESSEASLPCLPEGTATPPVITQLRSAYSLSLFWPDQSGEPRDIEELSIPSSGDGDSEIAAQDVTAMIISTDGVSNTGGEGCVVKSPTLKKPIIIVSDDTSKGDIFATLDATPVDDEGWDQDSTSSSTTGKGWRAGGVVHSSASELTISLAAYSNTGGNYSQKKALSYDSQGSSFNSVRGDLLNTSVLMSLSKDESDPGSLGNESASFRFSRSSPNIQDLGPKSGDKSSDNNRIGSGIGNSNSNGTAVKSLGTRRVSLVPEGNENEDDL